MKESPMTEANKRALVVAYYLSRFDRKGFRTLGYKTWNDAYAKIAEALEVNANTVKQMRDSFDPYCSQSRAGWHQRKLLPSRANVIQAFDEFDEGTMAEIVRRIMTGDRAASELYIAPVTATQSELATLLNENNAFAARLRTGELAEAYFIEQYPHLAQFSGSKLEDTRKLGIGFDFRIAFPQNYLAIEVKGVTGAHGYISFTDKEWNVARMLETGYILALVRSLNTTPALEFVAHPVAHIKATAKAVPSVALSWNAKV